MRICMYIALQSQLKEVTRVMQRDTSKYNMEQAAYYTQTGAEENYHLRVLGMNGTFSYLRNIFSEFCH
eukprot:m.217915 g.217915  ORF g.217915 m.217915 type:complete len:68 (+) comp15894_c2_seq2:111-314(+)